MLRRFGTLKVIREADWQPSHIADFVTQELVESAFRVLLGRGDSAATGLVFKIDPRSCLTDDPEYSGLRVTVDPAYADTVLDALRAERRREQRNTGMRNGDKGGQSGLAR